VNFETVMRLLIALCRYLEVPPETLAEFFDQGQENQQYLDVLVEIGKSAKGDSK